jgi:hypothetical protein
MQLTQELKDLITQSMLATQNLYAKNNNMNGATAIADAYFTLIKDLSNKSE